MQINKVGVSVFITIVASVATALTVDFGVKSFVPPALSQYESSISSIREAFEARYIASGSMLPTLQINDRILIDKLTYRSKLPKRGDIILFKPTKTLEKQNFKEGFINRIIGLPGETVKIKSGIVYINNKPLPEKYILEKPQYEYGAVKIPKSSYFVLGDNRNNAYDSHYWGFVPKQLIIGKAIGIYCPVSRQRLLEAAPAIDPNVRDLFNSVSEVFKNTSACPRSS